MFIVFNICSRLFGLFKMHLLVCYSSLFSLALYVALLMVLMLAASLHALHDKIEFEHGKSLLALKLLERC